MYIKRLFVLIILLHLLLAATTRITQAADIAPTTDLYFGGQKIDSDIRAVNKNGNQFVNLPFLSRFFNIVTAWNIEKSDLFLKFGKISFKLYANSPVYYINGISYVLPVAPFEADKQFWLPLEFITQLGLSVQSRTNRELRLDWSKNYLLSVENTTYRNRPAIALIGAKNFEVHDSMPAPDQVVLELPGVAVHDAFNEIIGPNPVLKQLSVDRANPDTPRLMLTLTKPGGYSLVRDPDHPNRIFVVFNYGIDHVKVSAPGTEHKIEIQTSFPADYLIVPNQTGPNQMIIDFSGASLSAAAVIPGDGQWTDFVQMAQLTPQTVRMTIHLASPAPCFVIRSKENPNILTVRTVQSMESIAWERSGPKETLSFVADGEIADTVQIHTINNHIQVNFNYLQFSGRMELPVMNGNFMKNLTWSTVDSTSVKAEFDLNGFVRITSEFSPDRRRLTFLMKPSPLIGKTIVLDPGHGGEDDGACGRQGTREKDNNLEISMRLKSLLEAAGASVLMTRTDDYFVGLYERSFMANYLGADLFISIHTNNHPDLNVRGIEVWHFQNHQTSALLAQDVLDEIVKETGFRSLGVKTESFVVVREAQMPGILVEVGFLSNFDEENIIRTREFRENAAQGIFEGIGDYLDQ